MSIYELKEDVKELKKVVKELSMPRLEEIKDELQEEMEGLKEVVQEMKDFKNELEELKDEFEELKPAKVDEAADEQPGKNPKPDCVNVEDEDGGIMTVATIYAMEKIEDRLDDVMAKLKEMEDQHNAMRRLFFKKLDAQKTMDVLNELMYAGKINPSQELKDFVCEERVRLNKIMYDN